MIEIERKFLVLTTIYKTLATKKERIVQGFLSTNPERTVRIRIKGEKGFITIKGKSNAAGMSRFEWEKEISVLEAQELLLLAEPGAIDKIRYEVPLGVLTIEVDEFFGENEGLTVAEIELPSEDTSVNLPDWLGDEVTGQVKYYNSQLSKHPFTTW